MVWWEGVITESNPSMYSESEPLLGQLKREAMKDGQDIASPLPVTKTPLQTLTLRVCAWTTQL